MFGAKKTSDLSIGGGNCPFVWMLVARLRASKTLKDRPSLLSIFTIAVNAFRSKTVWRRIHLNPRQNPETEGRIMIIHLLTCLALTAVTLSIFSWYVLTEERPS
ncbi:hypothetical protein [Pseudomonas sp. ANT_H12B]|uniref:hypothetical protein n=1 Tax=Pseudomonas sp. ANT_H12B TaxID=2597348 RepID=UPI0011ED7244|nr:hypothetical protein [Pseudomonas sp. ANT_H12B]KAA0980347.1 hypothetical protein FQ185_01790 [Pseudomonas sp. ANT_H12B]